MTRVKICGITDVAHVEVAAEAGADKGAAGLLRAAGRTGRQE